jgi:hypothetical protein
MSARIEDRAQPRPFGETTPCRFSLSAIALNPRLEPPAYQSTEGAEAIGYGESKPLASNKTAEARAAKPRVELVIHHGPVEPTEILLGSTERAHVHDDAACVNYNIHTLERGLLSAGLRFELSRWSPTP